jgi:hypothetical protein
MRQTLDNHAIIEAQLIGPALLATARTALTTRIRSNEMPTIASPQFYVYILCRPNGKPFYVGKGQRKRLYDHEAEAKRNCHCKKCNTIRKIWRNGGEVQRYIIFTTDDEQEALVHEVETIALYGRQNLVNQTDGGDGAGRRVGKLSAAHRAKLKAAQQARWARPEERAKASAGTKRYFADPEARIKHGIRQKTRTPRTPETQAKMTAATKAARSTPESRAKTSQALKGRPVSAEARAMFIARNKGKQKSPETRAKLSAAGKAYFSNPEARARQSAILKASDARRKTEQEKRDEG